MSEHYYWDRVTGTPCDVLLASVDGYKWVVLEGKTRPRTRRSDEVITMKEREKQVADRLASQRAARSVPFIPSIHKDAEVVRLESIVELLDNTVKWLIGEGNLPLTKDYLATPPHVVGVDPRFTKSAVPSWVDEVIRVAATT